MSIILSEITQSYQQAASHWQPYLFPAAQHLFGMLATIEIAWSGLLWAMNRNDVESLWVEFFKKMLTIGFFYTFRVLSKWVQVHPTFQGFIRVIFSIKASVSHRLSCNHY